MIPVGIFSLICEIGEIINNMPLHNAQIAGIGAFIMIIRTVLIIAPPVFIFSQVMGSRKNAYIGYTKLQLAFNIFLTAAIIAMYFFITIFWLI